MARKRKVTRALQPDRARNPLHDHPLLRKGAAHGKGLKAERRMLKVRLTRQWDDPSRLAA